VRYILVPIDVPLNLKGLLGKHMAATRPEKRGLKIVSRVVYFLVVCCFLLMLFMLFARLFVQEVLEKNCLQHAA
jgi:hypothetical protein